MSINQFSTQYILVPVLVHDPVYDCVPVYNTEKIQLPIPENFISMGQHNPFPVENKSCVLYSGGQMGVPRSNLNQLSALLNQNNIPYIRNQPELENTKAGLKIINCDSYMNYSEFCNCGSNYIVCCDDTMRQPHFYNAQISKRSVLTDNMEQFIYEKSDEEIGKELDFESYRQEEKKENCKISEKDEVCEDNECNREDFIRNQLNKDNEVLMSKEEMYHELLKPYQYRRIRVFDEATQKARYYYICGYEGCSKQFNKGWSILDHVRMHENIRPFKCEHCDRSFTQKCNLKKHNRRHLVSKLKDRKRFKCLICGKGFTERYNLKVNIKTPCLSF